MKSWQCAVRATWEAAVGRTEQPAAGVAVVGDVVAEVIGV